MKQNNPTFLIKVLGSNLNAYITTYILAEIFNHSIRVEKVIHPEEEELFYTVKNSTKLDNIFTIVQADISAALNLSNSVSVVGSQYKDFSDKDNSFRLLNKDKVGWNFNIKKFKKYLDDSRMMAHKNVLTPGPNPIYKDDNIDHLQLKDLQKHRADLFIDCTYQRLLTKDPIRKNKKNNKVFIAHLQYRNNDKIKKQFNFITALNNGYVIKSYHYDIIEYEYVASDEFASAFDLKEELRFFINKDIGSIPVNIEEKTLYDYGLPLWKNNVVSFSTHIDSLIISPIDLIIEQCKLLAHILMHKKNPSQYIVNKYNKSIEKLYSTNNIKYNDLLYLSNRVDSEYWSKINMENIPFEESLINEEMDLPNKSVFEILEDYDMRSNKLFKERLLK